MEFLFALLYLIGAYLTWTSYIHQTGHPGEGTELLASFIVFQMIWPIGLVKLIHNSKKLRSFNIRITFVPYLQLDPFRKFHETQEPYKVFIWLFFKITWRVELRHKLK